MLRELVEHLNRQPFPKRVVGTDSVPTFSEEVTIQNFTENGADSPSRGSMLMRYRTAVKWGLHSTYGYCDYFRDVADRAVRLWDLNEGTYRLRTGRDTPLCANDGFRGGGDWSRPLDGSVWSVLSLMFAMKMVSQSREYGLAYRTRSVLKRPPDWEMAQYYLDKGKNRKAVEYMGCVYFSGTLFITRDRRKYRQLIAMCDPDEWNIKRAAMR